MRLLAASNAAQGIGFGHAELGVSSVDADHSSETLHLLVGDRSEIEIV